MVTIWKLSKREWIVARMLGGGISHRDIARSLGIGEETVGGYYKRAVEKLRKNGSYIVGAFDLCLLIERGGLEWSAS